MIFRSLSSRLIAILCFISLLTFVVLVLTNTYFIRNAVVNLLTDLQRDRIQHLFAQLDARFSGQSPVDSLNGFLQAQHYEYDLFVFNRGGKPLAGTAALGPEQRFATNLQEEASLDGFAKVIYNQNPQSDFFAIKAVLVHQDLPILKKVLWPFLLSTIFVIIVSSTLGWVLIRYLNRRLARLKTGVAQISAGNFQLQLKDEGQDEIAFLAKSFNRMAAQLQQLIASLEQSNAARQRLIAHASHEIKSPLTSLKGFVDIIEYMNVLPEQQRRDLLPAVKKDLRRVIKISNDMLELARISTPEFPLDLRQFDLATLLTEEHSHFVSRARPHGARTQLSLDLPAHFHVHSDPERLSQILDNLWNNALKYGDLSQTIRTAARIDADTIRMGVSNIMKAGLTVAPEQLFEPFYRNPANPDKVAGAGLGLAIVKELAERLGGQTQARIDDKQITITILLPITK
ncbi:MAG: HAMP domain-containing histidine kinase [Deferribacteres bacterium]|nr:HAMP domain-containing histidine kinase [candidate division KSB1 bacterium]MCB9508822.1 HAMP domain-containing histidine kinase [Deferribacteres bacterium]